MSAADEVKLVEVLRTIAGRWRVILTFGLTGLMLAAAIAFLTKPVYRAETLVSFSGDDISGGGVAALASQLGGLSSIAGLNLGGSEGRKDVALALLTARGFLETFIEEEGLLRVLFADRWNAAENTWSSSRWSAAPTLADGVQKIAEQILRVTEDRRTGLIRVAVEWSDRDVTAEWANELVRRVNEVTRGLAITEAQESQKYLSAELDRTNVVELRQSVYRLIEAELEKEMVASVRVQYSFRVIDAAKAPDADDFVRPRRLVLMVFGLFMGLVLGLGAALTLNLLRGPSPK
jgi:uncharacterized protein involved in exopolysaccharide biosynthesis